MLISRQMKRVCLITLLSATSLAFAQDKVITLDDVVQSAQQWANENLDEDTPRTLQGVDQEKVKRFFDAIQKEFQGEYVIDLVQLRDAAKVILPILESREETSPYAVWLKTRMDYLDAADELRLLVPPANLEPGRPPPSIPNPPPEKEREVWIRKLSKRPWPSESKSYVASLKPVFAQQKIPPELVWIAEVESSFDPNARSPAGAVGLFQLMPATAKRYGLKTWPLDQRLEPEASARAAAEYLKYLHGRFKEWRLALAAYNAGEGTVQTLLDQYKDKANSYDSIATHLPAETQMFVPKVEATLWRREGLKLSELTLPRG
jgi:membrane-bound lytic murein transglycosylase D